MLSVDIDMRHDNYRVYAVPNPVKQRTQPQEQEPTLKPSLFHILPTDNPAQPHEFFITYVASKKKPCACAGEREGREVGELQAKDALCAKISRQHLPTGMATVAARWS